MRMGTGTWNAQTQQQNIKTHKFINKSKKLTEKEAYT